MRQDTSRSASHSELLEVLKKCNPAFFEKVVLDLLVATGLDAVDAQAKRWNGSVGRPTVQGAFSGAFEQHRAKKGVMMIDFGVGANAGGDLGIEKLDLDYF